MSTVVSGHTSCSVAVVRRDAPDDGRGTPVVVGTDGEPDSSAALDFVFDWAASERRPLQVVHSWVTDEVVVGPIGQRRREDLVDALERALGEAIAGFAEKYPDVTVSRLMKEDAAHFLVDMSAHASLLTVGSRGRGGLRAVLGSVSLDVVERTHCTVVVARS